MKKMLSDIFETKIFALVGGSPLFHFPVKSISFLFVASFVNKTSVNGQVLSLQVATGVLNNQRNQQQQIRMT